MIFKCDYINDKININHISLQNSFLSESIYVTCFGVTDLNFNNLNYMCNSCNNNLNKCMHVIAVKKYINDYKKNYNLLNLINDISYYLDDVLILIKNSKGGFIEREIQCDSVEYEKFKSYVNDNLIKLKKS